MIESSVQHLARRSPLFAVLIAGWISMYPTLSRGREPSRKGLVQERPQSGRFVKTDQGYMIAYEERIPGTDVRFQMVPIAGGRFRMGSPDSEPGRHDAEGPQVLVVVKPFWMGKHEITWKEFRIFMNLEESSRELFRRVGRRVPIDGVDSVTAPSEIYEPAFAYDGGEGPDTPAVTMTQFAAKQYTRWLSILLEDFYRLPSEAEWEYACRAGTNTTYSFGDDVARLTDYAWLKANSGERRHEVGRKLPNAWGLYDMHGNVSEWVLDAFTANGYTAIGGNEVDAEDAIQWPLEIYPRVARGGSWELGPSECRCAARLASREQWSEEDPELPNSPWWHTSFEATGRFWGASNPEFQEVVDRRIEEGKGIRGFVRPDQPGVLHPSE